MRRADRSSRPRLADGGGHGPLFVRRLRIARIFPEDLKRKLDAGESVAILDLRTALDVTAVPYAIPGSRWVLAEALDDHLAEIPRDRELVLYCS